MAMTMSSTLTFLFLAPLLAVVQAQTWTACNPLNNTGCLTNPALGMNYTFDFTKSTADSAVWNTTGGTVQYGTDGAGMAITMRGETPTIQSEFYFFFGVVEVWLKAATGQGVISSIVLESDDLDEVDWEFMGTNDTHAETNYFGKGNTTSYDRAIYYPVDKPQENFHNYTTLWTAEKIEWYIDGSLVRTLLYKDANNGKNFPQTPMNVRIGIWAGGDSANANGTVEWAGGLTDYKKGPYTMYVRSARVTDFSTGSEYKYGDKTGSWQSIQTTNGTSKIAKKLTAPPAQTPQQRWASFSPTVKIVVACVVGAVGLLILGLLTFCCVRQRRIGRREAAVEEEKRAKWMAELMEYRSEAGREMGKKRVNVAVREVRDERTGE